MKVLIIKIKELGSNQHMASRITIKAMSRFNKTKHKTKIGRKTE